MSPNHDLNASIERHLSRDIGVFGSRQVAIWVFTAADLRVQYSVLHNWVALGDSCCSLFFLLRPRGLAGTMVLLKETRSSPRTNVLLRLRSASRAVSVDPRRSSQRVLGTDLSYDDLRFRLPVQRYNFTHEATTPGSRRGVLSGQAQGTGQRVRVGIDPGSGLVKQFDWLESAGCQPRHYRAREVVTEKGIAMPRTVFVHEPADEHLTVMTLTHFSAVERPPSWLFDAGRVTDRTAHEVRAGMVGEVDELGGLAPPDPSLLVSN